MELIDWQVTEKQLRMTFCKDNDCEELICDLEDIYNIIDTLKGIIYSR